MSKEREELESKELKKLVLEGCFYYSESEAGYDEDEVVKSIQQAGYTKHPFDVEELERWLREEIIKIKKGLEQYDFYGSGVAVGLSMVLDKIRQLKEKG